MRTFLLSFFLSLAFCTISKAQTPIVSTNDLAKYIGQNITVCDSVYSIKTLDNVTFLTFAGDFLNTPLTLVIFKANRIKFPHESALLYEKKAFVLPAKYLRIKINYKWQ